MPRYRSINVLTKLCTGYTGGEEFLVAIAWEDDRVKSVLNKVKQIVNSNKTVPERYIFDAYTKYEPILQPPFRQSFEDDGQMTWDENEKVPKNNLQLKFTLPNLYILMLAVQKADWKIRDDQEEAFAAQITCLPQTLLFGLSRN